MTRLSTIKFCFWFLAISSALIILAWFIGRVMWTAGNTFHPCGSIPQSTETRVGGPYTAGLSHDTGSAVLHFEGGGVESRHATGMRNSMQRPCEIGAQVGRKATETIQVETSCSVQFRSGLANRQVTTARNCHSRSSARPALNS